MSQENRTTLVLILLIGFGAALLGFVASIPAAAQPGLTMMCRSEHGDVEARYSFTTATSGQLELRIPPASSSEQWVVLRCGIR